MSKKVLVLVAIIGLILPQLTQAIGLGGISVYSHLNEKLNADVLILSASQNERERLTVSLGSDALFAKYDIQRAEILNAIKFAIVNKDGRLYIRATSKKQISAPYINFVLQLGTPNGLVSREYAIFLDPVGPRANKIPIVSKKVSSNSQYQSSATLTSIPTAMNRGEVSEYGPVRRGQTLWSIAVHTRPNDSISINHMAKLIRKANPNAFPAGNSSLIVGSVLDIPTIQGYAPYSGGLAPLPETNDSPKVKTSNNSNNQAASGVKKKPSANGGKRIDNTVSTKPFSSIAEPTEKTLIKSALPSISTVKLVQAPVTNSATDVTSVVSQRPMAVTQNNSSDTPAVFDPPRVRNASINPIASGDSSDSTTPKATSILIPGPANSTLSSEKLRPRSKKTHDLQMNNLTNGIDNQPIHPPSIATKLNIAAAPVESSNSVGLTPATQLAITATNSPRSNTTDKPPPMNGVETPVNSQQAAKGPIINPVSKKTGLDKILGIAMNNIIYISGALVTLVLVAFSLKYARQGENNAGNQNVILLDQADVDNLFADTDKGNADSKLIKDTLNKNDLVEVGFDELVFANSEKLGQMTTSSSALEDDFDFSFNDKPNPVLAVRQIEKEIKSAIMPMEASKDEIGFDWDDNNSFTLETSIKQQDVGVATEIQEDDLVFKLPDETSMFDIEETVFIAEKEKNTVEKNHLEFLLDDDFAEFKSEKNRAPFSSSNSLDNTWGILESIDNKRLANVELYEDFKMDFSNNAEQEEVRMQMKLDLASSFISISDYVRSRELLNQVLDFGTDKQKDRAQTLLDNI